MHRTSIGTWAFNIGPYAERPVPFDEVGERLAELGFDGLELGGFNGYPNPNALPDREQRDALKDKVQGWGLGISGLAADLWSQHLIDTDDQGPYIAEFEKNADFARDLGIAGVRVDTVQPPTILPQMDYDVALRRVVRTWRRCAGMAADRGLYVMWEFEPGFAFNRPSDVLRVLDAIPEDNFGVMYDTCHGQMVAVVGARQHARRRPCRAASSSGSSGSRAGSTTST